MIYTIYCQDGEFQMETNKDESAFLVAMFLFKGLAKTYKVIANHKFFLPTFNIDIKGSDEEFNYMLKILKQTSIDYLNDNRAEVISAFQSFTRQSGEERFVFMAHAFAEELKTAKL